MGPVTISYNDGGLVRLLQVQSQEGTSRTVTVVLSATQVAAIKSWFALYGGATAPTNNETTNP